MNLFIVFLFLKVSEMFFFCRRFEQHLHLHGRRFHPPLPHHSPVLQTLGLVSDRTRTEPNRTHHLVSDLVLLTQQHQGEVLP